MGKKNNKNNKHITPSPTPQKVKPHHHHYHQHKKTTTEVERKTHPDFGPDNKLTIIHTKILPIVQKHLRNYTRFCKSYNMKRNDIQPQTVEMLVINLNVMIKQKLNIIFSTSETQQLSQLSEMLDLKLQDKTPCSEIRKRTKIIDIIAYTLKQKWKWAGHIARMEDNRWTKRCTEWQPRRRKRSRGRPSRRWQDDITEKEGTTWIRKATDKRQWKTLMEGYFLQ